MGSRVSSGKMAAAARVVQCFRSTLTGAAVTAVKVERERSNKKLANRQAKAVRPHAPLIKFPNRQGQPRPNVLEALKLIAASIPQSSPPGPAQLATPPTRPTGAISRLPGMPDSIAVVKELPQRYRRRELALEEMDYIQRGGPE